MIVSSFPPLSQCFCSCRLVFHLDAFAQVSAGDRALEGLMSTCYKVTGTSLSLLEVLEEHLMFGKMWPTHAASEPRSRLFSSQTQQHSDLMCYLAVPVVARGHHWLKDDLLGARRISRAL